MLLEFRSQAFPCSGLFLVEKDFKNLLLGGVETDKNGNIVGAKAILHSFFGRMNTTQALLDVHSITDAMGVYVSVFVCISSVGLSLDNRKVLDFYS